MRRPAMLASCRAMLSFTPDNTVENLKLSFTHFHDHNTGFLSAAQYKPKRLRSRNLPSGPRHEPTGWQL